MPPPPFYRQERCSSPYNPFQNPNPPPVFSKSLIRPCFLLVCHNTGPFCQKQIRWKTFRLRTFLFYEDEANHLQLPMLPWKWLNYNRTQPSLLWGYRGHRSNQEYWCCYVTLEIKHCLFLSLHVQPGWLHSGGIPQINIRERGNPNSSCRVIGKVSFVLNSSGIVIMAIARYVTMSLFWLDREQQRNGGWPLDQIYPLVRQSWRV